MGDEQEKGSEEAGVPTSEDEIKKEKKAALIKKAVRAVTVMFYLMGVFGGGTLLSFYYIIFWDPNINVPKPAEYLKSRARRSVGDDLVLDNDISPERQYYRQRYYDELLKNIPEKLDTDVKTFRRETLDNVASDRNDGFDQGTRYIQDHPQSVPKEFPKTDRFRYRDDDSTNIVSRYPKKVSKKILSDYYLQTMN